MKVLQFTFLQLLSILLIATCTVTEVHAADRNYQRATEKYQLPDVTLINQNGAKVRLKTMLESDQLVVVDFIFGTCTTICPVLSACFVNLQQKLGKDSQKVHLLSISIDPENDTPRVMKEYLKRFQAKPGWDFLTGSRRDIDAVMRAFNAYIPNKMAHYALTLIRKPQDGTWVRINGIMNTSEFMTEVQKAGIR